MGALSALDVVDNLWVAVAVDAVIIAGVAVAVIFADVLVSIVLILDVGTVALNVVFVIFASMAAKSVIVNRKVLIYIEKRSTSLSALITANVDLQYSWCFKLQVLLLQCLFQYSMYGCNSISKKWIYHSTCTNIYIYFCDNNYSLCVPSSYLLHYFANR